MVLFARPAKHISELVNCIRFTIIKLLLLISLCMHGSLHLLEIVIWQGIASPVFGLKKKAEASLPSHSQPTCLVWYCFNLDFSSFQMAAFGTM